MIFAALDFEDKVQLGDKTRFNAEKCFVSPAGETAISQLTITPGADGDEQDVFDSSDVSNRKLDWIFSDWTCDIVSGENDSIDFQQGETLLVAVIDEGTYTLSQLLSQVEAQMNDLSGVSGSFTLSIDSKHKITITNDSARFELLPAGENMAASLLPHIGFRRSFMGTAIAGTTVTGKPVEYLMKKISVDVGNGTLSSNLVKMVKVFSVAGDALFSSDQDLQTWEPDIMKWVPAGRDSFLNIQREAQEQILYFLDKEGYVNVYNLKYTKFDIIDVSEVKEWSMFKALEIIMWGISNKKDDVFLNKHFEYKKKAIEARDRAVLRLDVDDDGQISVGEQVDVKYGTVVTR